MGKASKWAKENKKFLVESAILAGAAIVDGYLTTNVMRTGVLEDNPFINSYIELYGSTGIYRIKTFMTMGGIFTMYIANKYPEKTRIKSSSIFRTGLAGFSLGSAASLYWMI
jgi:hypothetical protein